MLWFGKTLVEHEPQNDRNSDCFKNKVNKSGGTRKRRRRAKHRRKSHKKEINAIIN